MTINKVDSKVFQLYGSSVKQSVIPCTPTALSSKTCSEKCSPLEVNCPLNSEVFLFEAYGLNSIEIVKQLGLGSF